MLQYILLFTLLLLVILFLYPLEHTATVIPNDSIDFSSPEASHTPIVVPASSQVIGVCDHKETSLLSLSLSTLKGDFSSCEEYNDDDKEIASSPSSSSSSSPSSSSSSSSPSPSSSSYSPPESLEELVNDMFIRMNKDFQFLDKKSSQDEQPNKISDSDSNDSAFKDPSVKSLQDSLGDSIVFDDVDEHSLFKESYRRIYLLSQLRLSVFSPPTSTTLTKMTQDSHPALNPLKHFFQANGKKRKPNTGVRACKRSRFQQPLQALSANTANKNFRKQEFIKPKTNEDLNFNAFWTLCFIEPNFDKSLEAFQDLSDEQKQQFWFLDEYLKSNKPQLGAEIMLDIVGIMKLFCQLDANHQKSFLQWFEQSTRSKSTFTKKYLDKLKSLLKVFSQFNSRPMNDIERKEYLHQLELLARLQSKTPQHLDNTKSLSPKSSTDEQKDSLKLMEEIRNLTLRFKDNLTN